MRTLAICIGAACISLLFDTCNTPDPHQQMLGLLNDVKRTAEDPNNPFGSSAKLAYMDSLLALRNNTIKDAVNYKHLRANFLMELGREDEAIREFEQVVESGNAAKLNAVLRDLAIAYLRKGERTNCIAGHETESCIMPLHGLGIHDDPFGSTKAIEVYSFLLEQNPNDLESKWLLNLAYMTLGEYPARVPKKYLIPGLEGDTTTKVAPFNDIAGGLGIMVGNMAGGSIVDDFDGDGYLDIVTSSMDLAEAMHYFKNNADGTFTELSQQSGLSKFHGGLNMLQADYDNDGDQDILVLRGAWKREYGKEPNSLLQNQGNGTFIDVTSGSGLLSFHPTQTATWNDFNNDGWLDLFIGNESLDRKSPAHPCELYMNNGDGTFRDASKVAKANYVAFVKGVTSGDYDNDGWQDIFISTMSGGRILLKNNGQSGDEISFRETSEQAGILQEKGNTFPTWFWDYDNDGWLDIFTCDYTFEETLAYYAAAEKLNMPAGSADKMILYHNNHDGTFTNVASQAGLTGVVFAMGSNFGDIDNDGFLDMYLGTGNPHYQSILPNKMFKNIGGNKFADVTTSAAVGHLQKGHGVSFADIDNDGDQDIYIEMGGAYRGDAYQNAFFLNPGQGNNNWINIELTGTKSNRDAIGTRIKITFREDGVTRSVYRDVNSGGSFGASPMRREIGIGRAGIIDEIEIHWQGSNTVQRFNNINSNQFISITEGDDAIKKLSYKKIDWILSDPLCLPGVTVP